MERTFFFLGFCPPSIRAVWRGFNSDSVLRKLFSGDMDFRKTETNFFGEIRVWIPPAERGLGNECGRAFFWLFFDGYQDLQNTPNYCYYLIKVGSIKIINKKPMNKTWIAVLVIAVVAIGAWTIFGSKNSSLDTSKTIKVGVSQITSHAVFDDIKSGIIARFAEAGYKEGENIVFDFQNAQGDNSTNAAIAQKFANSGYDLFMPLGTQASQAVANLVKDKPIVFGAVTDPVTAGLVKSNENPGANITGTSDITLYKEHLELLKKLAPNVKKIGLVYNPGEANAKYGLEQTKKVGEQMGLEFITAPANNSGEVLSAARSIVGKVDAFYILSDNTIVSGQ